MNEQWIAARMQHIEASGIRKIFELARSIQNPCNLSIGQPDFDVPDPVKQAAHAAIDRGANAYTVTQGIPELREKIKGGVQQQYPRAEREVMITCGTSGGLTLGLLAAVNPGDEVILFDPYFVAYPTLVRLAGGVPVVIDTYPDYRIDLDRVRQAITPRTRAILVNSPGNPTGVVLSRDSLHALGKLAAERDILLISDEVYRAFCFDEPFASPAEVNDNVLVVDGFSKAYGMTGWRLGFAHGPKRLIEEMSKLQQFTFVCAPSVVQHAGAAALDFDIAAIVAEYRGKRDRIYHGLKDHFELAKPTGAFYAFPKAPWGTGTEFVTEAVHNSLLIIPGGTFSKRDTHFRISYAAEDRVLDRGIEILRKLARK